MTKAKTTSESTGKEVADWKETLAADAQAVAKQEQPAMSFIGLRGGTMTFMDTPVPDNTFTGIVLAATYTRTFYDRPFDPDDQSPPDCYAKAVEEHSLIPAENVDQPVAENCAVCPYSKFGSAPVGKGQACKLRRTLAIAPADGGDMLAVLNTPPTSNQAWSAYANKVATGLHLPPYAVTTQIKCVPFKTYFKLEFECLGAVDDKLLPGLHARIKDVEELLTAEIPMDSEQEQGEDSKKY